MSVPKQVLQWGVLADKYAAVYPILDPDEILAIIWTETWGDPTKINTHDPSYGLMQIEMPVGEKFAGVTTSEELMDPDTNVKAGAGFLAHLKESYQIQYPNHTWIVAYNEGEPNLLKNFKDSPYLIVFNDHFTKLKGESNA